MPWASLDLREDGLRPLFASEDPCDLIPVVMSTGDDLRGENLRAAFETVREMEGLARDEVAMEGMERGRWPTVWTLSWMYEWAHEFIDHATDAGADHVIETTFLKEWLPADPSMVGNRSVQVGREPRFWIAVEIVRAAHAVRIGISEARYRQRRSVFARHLLAALVDAPIDAIHQRDPEHPNYGGDRPPPVPVEKDFLGRLIEMTRGRRVDPIDGEVCEGFLPADQNGGVDQLDQWARWRGGERDTLLLSIWDEIGNDAAAFGSWMRMEFEEADLEGAFD